MTLEVVEFPLLHTLSLTATTRSDYPTATVTCDISIQAQPLLRHLTVVGSSRGCTLTTSAVFADLETLRLGPYVDSDVSDILTAATRLRHFEMDKEIIASASVLRTGSWVGGGSLTSLFVRTVPNDGLLVQIKRMTGLKKLKLPMGSYTRNLQALSNLEELWLPECPRFTELIGMWSLVELLPSLNMFWTLTGSLTRSELLLLLNEVKVKRPKSSDRFDRTKKWSWWPCHHNDVIDGDFSLVETRFT
jgi:hypothetical protein